MTKKETMTPKERMLAVLTRQKLGIAFLCIIELRKKLIRS